MRVGKRPLRPNRNIVVFAGDRDFAADIKPVFETHPVAVASEVVFPAAAPAGVTRPWAMMR
jgi:hypothetical protein